MAIPLRADFNAGLVRAAAKRSKDGPQARRLLALAAIYDGANRTEAAEIGGVTLQIIRDWVMRLTSGPDGLIDRKPPGQPSRLNNVQRQAIVRMIASGPIPAIKKSVRPATRPQSSSPTSGCRSHKSSARRSRISPKFVTPLAPPPVCTISLTLRRNLGLRGRAFIVRLQAIQ